MPGRWPASLEDATVTTRNDSTMARKKSPQRRGHHRITVDGGSGQNKLVLFVCVENTFRSVLSEAIFNAQAPDGWRAESAGVQPAGGDQSGCRGPTAGNRDSSRAESAPNGDAGANSSGSTRHHLRMFRSVPHGSAGQVRRLASSHRGGKNASGITRDQGRAPRTYHAANRISPCAQT